MTDTTSAVPHPGSPESVANGCTCPILDNAHGGGYMGMPGMFVMTGGCPLHAPAVPADEYCYTVRIPSKKPAVPADE